MPGVSTPGALNAPPTSPPPPQPRRDQGSATRRAHAPGVAPLRLAQVSTTAATGDIVRPAAADTATTAPTSATSNPAATAGRGERREQALRTRHPRPAHQREPERHQPPPPARLAPGWFVSKPRRAPRPRPASSHRLAPNAARRHDQADDRWPTRAPRPRRTPASSRAPCPAAPPPPPSTPGEHRQRHQPRPDPRVRPVARRDEPVRRHRQHVPRRAEQK